jgi:hypothetical protein
MTRPEAVRIVARHVAGLIGSGSLKEATGLDPAGLTPAGAARLQAACEHVQTRLCQMGKPMAPRRRGRLPGPARPAAKEAPQPMKLEVLSTRRLPGFAWLRAGVSVSRSFEPNNGWRSKPLYRGIVRRWARKLGPVGIYALWMREAADDEPGGDAGGPSTGSDPAPRGPRGAPELAGETEEEARADHG